MLILRYLSLALLADATFGYVPSVGHSAAPVTNTRTTIVQCKEMGRRELL